MQRCITKSVTWSALHWYEEPKVPAPLQPCQWTLPHALPSYIQYAMCFALNHIHNTIFHKLHYIGYRMSYQFYLSHSVHFSTICIITLTHQLHPVALHARIYSRTICVYPFDQIHNISYILSVQWSIIHSISDNPFRLSFPVFLSKNAWNCSSKTPLQPAYRCVPLCLHWPPQFTLQINPRKPLAGSCVYQTHTYAYLVSVDNGVLFKGDGRTAKDERDNEIYVTIRILSKFI